MVGELFFKISNSNETVKNQIKERIKNSFEALGEYIWNSIDSKSKKIYIDINHNENILRSITIKDDGEGINYDEIQTKLFKILSDSPKAKEHKDYLSLPHGQYGVGRFSFIDFAHQINWETTYNDGNNNYHYEISIDGNSLNNVEKIKEKGKTTENTGTITKITRIDNDQNLIKDSKKPLENIENYLIKEFYSIMKLYNIEIYLNKKPIDINKIVIKDKLKKKIKIDNYDFDMELILWDKEYCKDFKYYFINKQKIETYHIKSIISKYDLGFLHSVYITSNFFDNYSPISDSRNKDPNQQVITDSEKLKTYHKLIEKINQWVNETREPYNDKIAKTEVEKLEKNGYFDKILETKFDKEHKKPIVKNTTVAIIKFAPKILSELTKDQTLVFLNLINKLLDDDKNVLLDILRILLKSENEDSLKELKDILDKYKVGEVTSLIHEIQKRIDIINKIDKMHHNDKNKEYSEKDLQEILEDNFWIFGDNYSSLICSEEEDFTKMRNIFIKEILKKNPEEFKDKVSGKQVDLFLHGIIEIDKRNKNLIVEIKKPDLKLSKEIYYEQLVEYAEIIRKRPEFNDKEKNEWNFLLVGHDFKDDFFTSRYAKKSDYLMEEIPDTNIRLYVMRWTDIISDLKLKYKFLKDRLNSKKEKMIKKEI
jgi:hypothetical protein